jgi:hypothetical protein
MNQFERELKRYAFQGIPRNERLFFGVPSGPLQRAGVPPYPMLMSGTILKKVLTKHSLSVSQLILVQEKLNVPIMVFKSDSISGAKLSLSPITSKETPIVVAIHQEKLGRKSINAVKSIHPRPVEQLLLWMEKGLLLAADKVKSQQWLENRARCNTERYLAIAGQIKSLTSEQQSQGRSRG